MEPIMDTSPLNYESNSVDDMMNASIPSINIIRPSIDGHSSGETKSQFAGEIPDKSNVVHPNATIGESNDAIPTQGHKELNEGQGPSAKGNEGSHKGYPSGSQGQIENEQTHAVNAQQKWREQRLAREKARLEKLRQMNLVKYKNEDKNGQNTSKSKAGSSFSKSSAGHMIPKPSVGSSLSKSSAGHSKPNPGKIPKSIPAYVLPKPNISVSIPNVKQITKSDVGDAISKLDVGRSLSKPSVGNPITKPSIGPNSAQNTEGCATKTNVPSKIRMSTIPTYNKPLPITRQRVSVVPSASKDKIMPVIPARCSMKPDTHKNLKLNSVSLKKDLPPNEINLKKDVPINYVTNNINNLYRISSLTAKKITPHKSIPSKAEVRNSISVGQVNKNTAKVPTARVRPMPSNNQNQRSKVPPPNRFTLSSMHRRSVIPKVNTEGKPEISKFVPEGEKLNTNTSDHSVKQKISDDASDSRVTDVRQALIDQVYGVQKQCAQKLSVFDRLSKPKYITNKVVNTPHEKRYSQFTGKTENKHRHSLIPAKSQSLADTKMRRSISSVHFKRLAPNQRKSCIHRSSSVSESMNRKQIDEINEDDEGKDEVVYAVKSERKKTVKFTVPHTPGYTMNTPRPADLRMKLANWLHTKGRSVNSYQHLQCFGINNLITKPKAIPMAELKQSDDENKENVEVSDDASFTDNLEDRQKDFDDGFVVKDSIDEQMDCNNRDFGFDDGSENWDKWRHASYHMSDTLSTSIGLLEDLEGSKIESLPEENAVGEIIIGALIDLLNLIREGYEWEQCARWLRAIRERYPESTESALYWECRAALEEQRGNFPRTLECWERAIIQGVKPSTVEASLDQILDKFMQLKLSPNSAGKGSAADPKLLDVKNVVKSTFIRFAVQQKRIRESQTKHEITKFTATPVRRSSRLDRVSLISAKCREEMKLKIPEMTADKQEGEETTKTPENDKPKPKLTPYRQSATRSCRRTPLVQICSSLQQIDEDVRKTLVFVPNKALQFNNSP